MRLVRNMFLLVPFVAGTVPLQAQIPDRETSSSTTEVRDALKKFAQCVVRNNRMRALAAQVILQDIPNQEIVRKYRSLIDADCLPSAGAGVIVKLSMPGDYFRYAIAEALVTKEIRQPFIDFKPIGSLQHATRDSSDFTPKPGTYTKKQMEKFEESRVAEEDRIFASKFGECVVRTDPVNSYKLLFTKSSSPEEGAVFATLYPALGSCLVPGQKIKIEKSMVRGTIALNYYRLARAAQSGLPSQGNTK